MITIVPLDSRDSSLHIPQCWFGIKTGPTTWRPQYPSNTPAWNIGVHNTRVQLICMLCVYARIGILVCYRKHGNEQKTHCECRPPPMLSDRKGQRNHSAMAAQNITNINSWSICDLLSQYNQLFPVPFPDNFGVPTKLTIWTHTDTKIVKKTSPLRYQTLKHAHMRPMGIPDTFP